MKTTPHGRDLFLVFVRAETIPLARVCFFPTGVVAGARGAQECVQVRVRLPA